MYLVAMLYITSIAYAFCTWESEQASISQYVLYESDVDTKKYMSSYYPEASLTKYQSMPDLCHPVFPVLRFPTGVDIC